MLACFLLLPAFMYAQVSKQKPVVTKGYYSIGNNAQKLKSKELPIQLVEVTNINESITQKGYYSIKRNDSNRKKQFFIQVQDKKVPVINKGYYSIGNNAKKLVQ